MSVWYHHGSGARHPEPCSDGPRSLRRAAHRAYRPSSFAATGRGSGRPRRHRAAAPATGGQTAENAAAACFVHASHCRSR